MSSIPTRYSDLASLPRRSLQSLCKLDCVVQWGKIKANAKNADIIDALASFWNLSPSEAQPAAEAEPAPIVAASPIAVSTELIPSVNEPAMVDSPVAISQRRSTRISSRLSQPRFSSPHTPAATNRSHRSSAAEAETDIHLLEQEIAQLEQIKNKSEQQENQNQNQKATGAGAKAKGKSSKAAVRPSAQVPLKAPETGSNDMYWQLLAELDKRVETRKVDAPIAETKPVTAAAATVGANKRKSTAANKFDRAHKKAADQSQSIVDYHENLMAKKRKLDNVKVPACAFVKKSVPVAPVNAEPAPFVFSFNSAAAAFNPGQTKKKKSIAPVNAKEARKSLKPVAPVVASKRIPAVAPAAAVKEAKEVKLVENKKPGKFKFDLKESLAKPITWKMKKGALRPGNDKESGKAAKGVATKEREADKENVMEQKATETENAKPFDFNFNSAAPFRFSMGASTQFTFVAAPAVSASTSDSGSDDPEPTARERRSLKREFKAITFNRGGKNAAAFRDAAARNKSEALNRMRRTVEA